MAELLDIAALVKGRSYTPFADGDVGLLPLSRGEWAVVDLSDFDRCAAYKWSATSEKSRCQTVYGVRVEGEKSNQKAIRLHRFVLDALAGLAVDHINGDGRDNRRANLRQCSVGQNNCNRVRTTGASSYLGVIWDGSRGQWQARVTKGGRSINAGRFNNERDAALARDAVAVRVHGEFARLNFPRIMGVSS